MNDRPNQPGGTTLGCVLPGQPQTGPEQSGPLTPWNPTLAECLELEADISAEKRRAAEWNEIRQWMAEIRARQAQP